MEGLFQGSGQQGGPYWAALMGKDEVVSQFLDMGWPLDQPDCNWHTMLHLASFQGHLSTCKLLLLREAAVGARDFQGFAPIHMAAWKGQMELVDLLLDSGAEVNEVANDGRTPLYLAMHQGHFDLALHLISKGGAYPVVKDNNSGTEDSNSDNQSAQMMKEKSVVQADVPLMSAGDGPMPSFLGQMVLCTRKKVCAKMCYLILLVLFTCFGHYTGVHFFGPDVGGWVGPPIGVLSACLVWFYLKLESAKADHKIAQMIRRSNQTSPPVAVSDTP